MDIGSLLQNVRLPSPAPVVLELYQVLDHGGAAEIAKIIESDTALSARLLRLANSAFYPQSPVATVRNAVLRVGAVDVAALVVTTEVVNCFHGISEAQLSLSAFWEHSLRTACFSRVLSESDPATCVAPLWMCGLLHDVGKLLLLRQAPAEYAQVLARTDEGIPLLEAEVEQLGFTHAEAGEQLFRLWCFPEVISTCVGRHHVVHDALTTSEAIVAAANELANEALSPATTAALEALDGDQIGVDAQALYQSYQQLFSEYLQ